jgi:sulfate transport system permease protein
MKTPGTAQPAAFRTAPDPWWLRWALTVTTLAFLLIVLVSPIVIVFSGAFADGARVVRDSLTQDDAVAAIRLTLTAVAIAVPLNLVFGIVAALALGHGNFPGKRALITVIDVPFAISPVVSGLVFVLLFGINGPIGSWFDAHGIRIIFAVPGIVLATVFVTVPFVARELIPLVSEQGREEELAAVGLGAGFWQTFRRVTLPKIKWGILYGTVLLVARAVGEFGAVSVVSGHIRGETTTVPLHIEMLYNEYNFPAAFSMAAVLTLIALCTVIATSVIEWASARRSVTVEAVEDQV